MPKSKRTEGEQTSESKKRKLDADFASAFEDGWKIGKNRLIAKREGPMLFKRVSETIKEREEVEFGYMDRCTLYVWDYLVVIINRELVSRNSSTDKNPVKATTKEELIKWYSIWIEIENTAENDKRNLEKHLDRIDLSPKLGKRRFKMIKTAMQPNITELKELCSLFSKNAKKSVRTVSLVIIDE